MITGMSGVCYVIGKPQMPILLPEVSNDTCPHLKMPLMLKPQGWSGWLKLTLRKSLWLNKQKTYSNFQGKVTKMSYSFMSEKTWGIGYDVTHKTHSGNHHKYFVKYLQRLLLPIATPAVQSV